MPAATRQKRIGQAAEKGLQQHAIQTYQAYINQSRRQPPRVIELGNSTWRVPAVIEALMSSRRRTGTRGST